MASMKAAKRDVRRAWIDSDDTLYLNPCGPGHSVCIIDLRPDAVERINARVYETLQDNGFSSISPVDVHYVLAALLGPLPARKKEGAKP